MWYNHFKISPDFHPFFDVFLDNPLNFTQIIHENEGSKFKATIILNDSHCINLITYFKQYKKIILFKVTCMDLQLSYQLQFSNHVYVPNNC